MSTTTPGRGAVAVADRTSDDIAFVEGKPHMAQVGDRVLDPQVDFCFSEEPVPAAPVIPPKRWVCREVADAGHGGLH